MLNFNWLWTELYRLNRLPVERCAGVLQIKGARKALRSIYQEAFDSLQETGAPPEALARIEPDRLLAQNDDLYKTARRVAWSTLLAVGTALTVQPWFEFRWFGMVIMMAGLMLCVLEFSPNSGVGFVAMVLRYRKSAKPGDKNK